MTKKPDRLQKVIPGILLVIGALVFLSGALQAFVQLVSIHLPAIKARVTKTRVVSVSDAGSPTSYQPEVEFQYRILGKDYSSKTFATTNSTGYPAAKRVSDGFSPGTDHEIRYSPINPEEIYANAGYTLDFFLLPIALLVLGSFFIGVSLWFLVPRKAPRKRLDSNRVQRLAGWIFTLAGLVLLLGGASLGYSTYRVSKTWLAADAQVTDRRVHQYVATSSQRHQSVTHYEAIVDFQYSAGGQEYVSPAAEDFTSSAQFNGMLARYAPGSSHRIRYDPLDPNDVRFAADANFLGMYIFIGVACVFELFGGTCLLLSHAKRNQ